MIPTISDLQRMFPLGLVELDAQARRELTALAVLRNMFVSLREREEKESTCQEINKRADSRLAGKEDTEESDRIAITVEEAAKIMDSADSVEPGLDLASAQDMFLMAEEFSGSLNDGSNLGLAVLAHVAASNRSVALHLVSAGVLGAIAGLMRNTVVQCMYRRHPGVRFPIQCLVNMVIDPGDTGRSVNATINGYAVDVLHDIRAGVKFKAPDTAEEFLRGCGDKGADNANNPA
jgi:hypothetical protein